MDDPIQLKGIREGILVTIAPEGEWAQLVAELASRMDKQPGFFRGATLVLAVGKRGVRRHELANLVNLLQKRDVTLVSVLSSSATTQGATRKLGLATQLADVAPAQTAPPTLPDVQGPPTEAPALQSEVTGEQGVLIRQMLRGGKTIHSDGHVVVLGDVNPGAEIIAVGDIIVWGHLRGVVHAGAAGDESAVVCALDLQPTQLRIASLISVSPPAKKRRKPQPERAYVEDGQIKAESWSG